jgi:YfiH family protein
MNIIWPFEDEERIAAGFFGRRGGVSSGIYDSLNCGPGSGDDLDAVFENRRRAGEVLGGKCDGLKTLYQVHSATCVRVGDPSMDTRMIEADALVTSLPGVTLGVLTADCGPVLFYAEGRNGPVVGAAHAGWGGAVKGVLEETIKAIREEGAELSSIRAALGPCIGPDSYEVSQGFEKPFLEEDPTSCCFFGPAGVPDKFRFDLPSYIQFRLLRAGLSPSNVSLSGIDTYEDQQGYFSFRRATHAGEKVYGRQISAIMVR